MPKGSPFQVPKALMQLWIKQTTPQVLGSYLAGGLDRVKAKLWLCLL
jgi:hypothetical protein